MLRALALVLVLAAGPALAEELVVKVGHNKLDPGKLTIHAGDTVVFHNLDQMPGGHTVVSDDGKLASPPLEKEGKWSYTFAAPGRYGFKIKEHPSAVLTIVVE